MEERQVSPVIEAGAAVQRVAEGFFNLSGGTADAAGNLYFVDAHWQRIYKWEPAAKVFEHRARRSARSSQSHFRQIRQPDRDFLRGHDRDRLLLSARKF